MSCNVAGGAVRATLHARNDALAHARTRHARRKRAARHVHATRAPQSTKELQAVQVAKALKRVSSRKVGVGLVLLLLLLLLPLLLLLTPPPLPPFLRGPRTNPRTRA